MTGGMVYDENASPPAWYGTAKTDPNKMLYHTSSLSGPQNVHTISQETGGIQTVTTLDESPPIFDKLMIQDPTAYNDRIIVTFTLNEDGTAYCRVTRSDSGETNLKINRILTADWSATHDGGASDQTITISKLENALYSDAIDQQQEYDIYCWAKDNALDTASNPRPNYQTQTYVNTEIATTSGPEGGATKRVWVLDSTPPTLIYVSGEAIAEDTIQLTLQLDEPGTIWCTPIRVSGASTVQITEDNYGATKICSDTNPAPAPSQYYETCVKGSNSWTSTRSTIFRVYVPEAYRNVDLEMDSAALADLSDSEALEKETAYKYMCFAKDDWETQAPDTTNGARSPNYVAG